MTYPRALHKGEGEWEKAPTCGVFKVKRG